MSASSDAALAIGDIVWAQMKPWKPWPGQIVHPPKSDKIPDSKKNSFYVYFFGSENYGWITQDKIWPYEKLKNKYCQNYKGKDFLSGVKTADEKCKAKKSGGNISSSSEDAVEEEKNENDKQEKIILKESSSSARSEVIPLESIPSTSTGITHRKRKASRAKPKKDSLAEESSAKNVCLKDMNSTLERSNESRFGRMKTLEYKEKDTLKKHKVGVLGLGALGGEITMSLLAAGHDVTVWNRTEAKCAKYVEVGAKKGDSPGAVLKSCEVTLVCVNSAEAVKYLIFMTDGLNSTADEGCDLVVMTLMNPESSIDIEDVITQKKCRYLEAPLYRIDHIEPPNLTVLAAGNEGIFADYESVFKAFAKKCIFLGVIGQGTKTSLLMHSFFGSIVVGVAESMCIAEKTGVSQSELLNVIAVSPLGSQFLLDKAKAMMEKNFTPHMPLLQVTEAMRYALNMSKKVKHSMPLAAAAAEMFVAATALNLGERDMSAVYMPIRY